jgi:hypothetical protein
MWKYAGILLLVAIGVTFLQAKSDRGCSTRDQIEQALIDFGHLKSGMTRQDVERYFVLDGGMNFRGQSYYVHQNCNLIRVEVTFDLDPKLQNGFSPRDTITKLSKLYLSFPSKD